MIIKCNCNHCSTHLEFESGNEGVTINCPSCGMETRLYAPPPAPAPILPPKQAPPPLNKPIADPAKTTHSSAADALLQVRVDSCYKTLRGLIDLVQFICIAAAVIVGIAGIAQVFTNIDNAGSLYGLFWFLGAAGSVILAIASKQAALLLVDIADCQIQQVKRRG